MKKVIMMPWCRDYSQLEEVQLVKKAMKQDINLNFEDSLELPSYGIVLASTIFFKKVRIELLKKHLQEYFRQKMCPN